jgi:hypothetical protein
MFTFFGLLRDDFKPDKNSVLRGILEPWKIGVLEGVAS